MSHGSQPLGDLIRVRKGKRPKSLHDSPFPGSVPYLDLAAVEHGQQRQFAARSESRVVERGTLVMVWDGARSGWVGLTPFEGALGSTLATIESDLEVEFLLAFLQAHFDVINSQPRGTGIPHVNREVVQSLQIPIMSRPEQQAAASRIQEALSLAYSVGSRSRSVHRHLEDFRASVLFAATTGRLSADWRSSNPDAETAERALSGRPTSHGKKHQRAEDLLDLDLPTLPGSYLVSCIRTVADVLDYGISEKLSPIEEGVPVLRMGNILNGELDLGDLKYSDSPKAESTLLETGDLLFNRTNSPELVGKTAVFRSEGRPTSFASYLIRVRFDRSIVEPDFACYWINSAWGRLWAQAVKTDGVSQSNINGTKLGAMPLPLPPIAEQREIVARVEGLFRRATELNERVNAVQGAVSDAARAVLASIAA